MHMYQHFPTLPSNITDSACYLPLLFERFFVVFLFWGVIPPKLNFICCAEEKERCRSHVMLPRPLGKLFKYSFPVINFQNREIVFLKYEFHDFNSRVNALSFSMGEMRVRHTAFWSISMV